MGEAKAVAKAEGQIELKVLFELSDRKTQRVCCIAY